VSRNGVEIPAAMGSVIRSVAVGRVVFADWFPGYGKMVIVDHGGHLHSIYGFASEVSVEAGAAVGRGQGIARVGATGTAPEPRLYFEMRLKGVPENVASHLPELADRIEAAKH
jgi:septal ring factor EnvC (AmiA/AmiB activator)